MNKKEEILNIIKLSIALLLGVLFLYGAFTMKDIHKLFSTPKLLIGISLITLSIISLYNILSEVRNSVFMDILYVITFVLITLPLLKNIFPIGTGIYLFLEIMILTTCLVFYFIAFLTIEYIVDFRKKNI